MKKKRIISEHVKEPPPNTYSNCIVVGDQVFMSGICSMADTAYDQSKKILQDIQHVMEAASGTMSDIVRFNIYLTDMSERDQVLKARGEFFEEDFPASTLVEVSQLAHPSFKVEIEATAILGSGER